MINKENIFAHQIISKSNRSFWEKWLLDWTTNGQVENDGQLFGAVPGFGDMEPLEESHLIFLKDLEGQVLCGGIQRRRENLGEDLGSDGSRSQLLEGNSDFPGAVITIYLEKVSITIIIHNAINTKKTLLQEIGILWKFL